MNLLTHDTLCEFKGQIVDLFEDFFADKEIDLYNEDKEIALEEGEYDDPSEMAILYGDLYDLIGDEVEDVVHRYSLFTTALWQTEDALGSVIDSIMNGFDAVLEEGRYKEFNKYEITNSDRTELRDMIKDTFIKWGLVSI